MKSVCNNILDNVRNSIAILLLFICFNLQSQMDTNRRFPYSNKNEREIIDELKLVANAPKKQQESYIIAHKKFKKPKVETYRFRADLNLILYSLLILLIPVISLLITYYQKFKVQNELNQKQKEINEEKILFLLKDQELQVIKACVEDQDKRQKRIAQELHDSIGGNLAAIKLHLNNSYDNDNGALKVINAQIDDTYELVRNISQDLIPKKNIKNDFCDIIQEYVDNIERTSDLKTSFHAYPRKSIDVLNETLQIEIFNIIKELVTNSIKHAKGSSIELQLNLTENELNILFEDDGIGFDVSKKAKGFGFRHIKNRLKKIHGTIDIDSRIHRGTIINVEITNVTTTVNEIQPNYS